MKASEVLERYAAGERNFQRLNLRGQSFKNQNLSGADFSEADIRSANFAGGTLKGTSFTGAKCGLQKRWATFLTILSWLMTAISGLCSIAILSLVNLIFDTSNSENQIAAWVSLIAIVIFLIVILRQGTRAFAVAGALVVAGSVVGIFLFSMVLGIQGAAIGVVALSIAGAVAGVVILSVAVAAALAVGGLKALEVAGVGIVFTVYVVGGIFTVVGVETAEGAFVGAFAGALAFAEVGLGGFLAWRAMIGDYRDAEIRSFAIAFAALRGTSFRGADLTEANFTSARLKSTDFRQANLTRVRWYGAKMLNRVRAGNSYLQSDQIRQWLIGKGIDKNFDRQDLRSINLQGADLTDASFIGADLSEANLQGANLSRAKLVQTQLDETDLTGAILTGACIEDWNITSHTKLDNVKCEYIFMRLPTKDNPEPRRKPDNRSEVFKDNDFADFIKPFFDTLDLYHNQEVDPRAIAISWKKLAEDNPDANLRFASMEVKGEDNLLLRLKTAPNADLSKLSAEYFETYNQIKALAEQDVQKLIAEKDDRIQALENMVNTALKRPGFYAENYTHQGDNQMNGEKRDIKTDTYYEQSGKIGIGHVSGGKFNNTKISGEINETQQQNLADAAAEIQNLLEQLSQTYPTNTSKEKNLVVAEVVDQIENNSTLKAKVINALQAGGKEALKEAIDHPLVNILMATIEGWQNS